MGEWTHALGGDSRTETGDARVGELPHVVATVDTRVAGEAGQNYTTRSRRV